MLGFVVKKINISANTISINKTLAEFTKIETISALNKEDFIYDGHFYISKHKDTNQKDLTLFHLMIDLSENIYKPKKNTKKIESFALS